SANAAEFAASVARSAIIFSDMFGPIPDPSFTLIQIPDGTLRDFAAPGVLLLSQRAWDPKGSDRTISRLVASQWWGVQVLPATPGDVWISDGLVRYSEALYAEQNAGKEAGLRAVDEFAVGALMYEDAAPVAQAARLAPYSPDYRSVVVNKGALLFHMLRAQMGDAAFKVALHDFYFQFAEKSARIDDFEKIAERRVQATAKSQQDPPNLQAFFAQWLNSTGVPEFTLEYVVYRTPKGFRVNGKIKQPLDTFRMPVELRIDTEGNPELKTIDVIGTESGFTVETFGRPKPNGIKIGEIFDLLGQRERAVNEYSKAKQTNDDTGSAQATAERHLKKAYSEGGGTSVAAPATGEPAKPAMAVPTPASGEKPVLKKPT